MEDRIKKAFRVPPPFEKLAADIDAQIKGACEGMAGEFGVPRGETLHETCQQTARALREARAQMGTDARLSLQVQPVRCTLSMTEMARCAERCETQPDGAKPEVWCEGASLGLRTGGRSDVEEGRCAGKLLISRLSAGCRAACRAQIVATTECSPERVEVKIEGATDAQAQARFTAAIQNHLGQILQIVEHRKAQLSLTLIDGEDVAQDFKQMWPREGKTIHDLVEFLDCIRPPLSNTSKSISTIRASIVSAVTVQKAVFDSVTLVESPP